MADDRAADDASNGFASAAAAMSAATTAVGAEAAAPAAPSGPVQAWPAAVGVVLRAFNHVLGQHAWARERLAPFAGQTIRTVVTGPLGDLSAAATVGADGMLRPAAIGTPPAVSLSVRAPLDALAAVAGQGMPAAMRHVRIEGDAALAAAVGQIVPHLRWDFEDDLSRLVGDTAARRVTDLLGRVRDGLRDLRLRSESAAVGYLVHENAQLVSAPMAEAHRAAVRALRDDLERLEKRIERIERR